MSPSGRTGCDMRFLLLIIVFVTLLVSCAPKKGIDESSRGCIPQNLRIDAANEAMTVIWDVDCNQMISGYYIYIEEEPLVSKYPGTELPTSIKPFNMAAFPGDTEPDDVEHFLAEGLENGKKYFKEFFKRKTPPLRRWINQSPFGLWFILWFIIEFSLREQIYLLISP